MCKSNKYVTRGAVQRQTGKKTDQLVDGGRKTWRKKDTVGQSAAAAQHNVDPQWRRTLR